MEDGKELEDESLFDVAVPVAVFAEVTARAKTAGGSARSHCSPSAGSERSRRGERPWRPERKLLRRCDPLSPASTTTLHRTTRRCRSTTTLPAARLSDSDVLRASSQLLIEF